MGLGSIHLSRSDAFQHRVSAVSRTDETDCHRIMSPN